MWSARGLLSIRQGDNNQIFLIPKNIYVCSIIPTHNKLLKELNKIMFKFLWKGVYEVTRASVINNGVSSNFFTLERGVR